MVDHGFLTTSIVCVRSVRAGTQSFHFISFHFISFHPLPTRNEAGTKPLTKLPETSYISVCYHYDSGDVEILPVSRHEEATGRELIAALRQLYRYSLKRTTVRLSSTKSGRNDPCPFGSGKKFKKCCGA